MWVSPLSYGLHTLSPDVHHSHTESPECRREFRLLRLLRLLRLHLGVPRNQKPEASTRFQVAGYRLSRFQVTGYRLQVTLQVTGYRLQVTGYRV